MVRFAISGTFFSMQEGSLTTRDNNTPPPPNARIKLAVVVSYSPRVESVNRVDVGLRNATPSVLSHKRAQPRKLNEEIKVFKFVNIDGFSLASAGRSTLNKA